MGLPHLSVPPIHLRPYVEWHCVCGKQGMTTVRTERMTNVMDRIAYQHGPMQGKGHQPHWLHTIWTTMSYGTHRR